MNVEFSPEALREFEDSALYYAECQPGLETRLVDCIEAAVRDIVDDPLRWRIFDGEVRRYLTAVFPFAVLYRVLDDRIVIIAVMHCHRAPGYWRHRS